MLNFLWFEKNDKIKFMNIKNLVYCAYFDKGFLLKGLALHSSLLKYNPDAKLWILAFDKYTEDILRKMKLKGVTVVPLAEFEDKELLAVKGSRNPVEYYWTCTPSLPLYIFKRKPDTKYVVYLDGDLYFYLDAMVGVEEIADKSILAVEHRFPKGMESMSKVSGRFNVGFNVFKNDKVGIKCLKRWRAQCLDWCYWRPKDGKLGDQMYLNEWPKLYEKNLVISENIGVDTAPWNVSQYEVSKKGNDVYINNKKLVCYHFHQFQILGPDHFSRVLGYTLSREVVKLIYEPYEAELRRQYTKVKSFDKSFEIKRVEQNINQVFRAKLSKLIGPVYWRIKGWLGN